MTTSAPPSGPNAEQIQYWNETAGPKWVALQAMIDAQIRPLGRAAMQRADLAPGVRVLDVGCGCGDTSIELSHRVTPGGSVCGIDISAPMLERARASAHAAGAEVHFELADAQTHPFSPTFDLCFSRFGVMFFTDPTAAFTNLRRALRPGGRLAFVCWQGLSENPWMTVPLGAALQHLPLPPMPAPDAPGPFAFADSERVRGILGGAGFGALAFESVREELTLGGDTLDATVEFLLQLGPAAVLMRDADPALRPRVVASVREALAPYATANGVRMPSATWVVTGRSD
ncbi:MAG: class I SAM-dependent methyltransferase [Candidatus Binatia bacterium]